MKKNKYFAKYLPVEGKIKEGELLLTQFHHVSNGQSFIVDKLTNKEWNHHTIWNDGNERDYSKKYLFSFINEYWKRNKVKLFLCSRDIQVGDITYVTIYEDFLGKTNHKTIKIENAPEHLSKGLMCYSEDGYYEYLKDCIKVIGEISPDAVWVTEGMEFDEDEVQFITLSYTMFSRDEPERISCTEKEWLSTKIEDYGTISKSIEIKCPTCKQFH